MWEKIRVIFTIPELRQKILLTLFLLAIYRVGFHIPLLIVDQSKSGLFSGSEGDFAGLLDKVALLSASDLNRITIFGLGIMPYISASIIFQLLGSVWKPLEELQKEGESGRRKINEYTRYATVALCFVQSWFYVGALDNDPQNMKVLPQFLVDGSITFTWHFIAVMVMTCGTIFLMWLGEQIDEYGIGNGISLLIMAGIVARMPAAAMQLVKPLWENGLQLGVGRGETGIETLLVLAVLFVGVIAGVVFITQGQLRIPTQSAKHFRGRRVYGGTKQYLPLKVNQAGVMPIIFASSLLMFPTFIFSYLGSTFGITWLTRIGDSFSRESSFIYCVCYVAMIYFFCYFWTAITFNPKDMADNLKNFGSYIPGYRPGKRTADHLERIMVRITYVGAGFLAIVAIAPTLISQSPGVQIDPATASFYGGTGLLIAVSVAFDLVQKIDSHLVMRNYKGLLE
ncbi:MAG: preprotein translocase subunit SecY [Planctomycetia bacterium]|nr:preprotein translocase subunit SecY [Planctomycetia bacterium]